MRLIQTKWTTVVAALFMTTTCNALAYAQDQTPVSTSASEIAAPARQGEVAPDPKTDRVADAVAMSLPAQSTGEQTGRTTQENYLKPLHGPFDSFKAITNSTTASGTTPQAAGAGEWQFQVTPYLWIVGLSGNGGIGNLVVDVDSGVTSSDIHLNFGFMATFEARKDRWVILTDFQYSNLGTDNPTPGPLFLEAQADFKTLVIDPEVGYRVVDAPEKGAYIDVLGGIRYWRVEADLTLVPQIGIVPFITASRSRSWVDAVVGLRGKTHISKSWFVTGKADLGGGGSQFTYQLFGGGGVMLGKSVALIGGYRYLSVDYDRDNFLFDMALHGPILGVGFKF